MTKLFAGDDFMFKKKKLFGNKIEPDCSLCYYADNNECSLGAVKKPCGRFRYDPLKRTPENLPPLQHFSKNDFEL
jgi:hypothetical protein